MPAEVARALWTQDAQMTDGGTAIEDDATSRVAQARQNEDAQRQARQRLASFMLGTPFQPTQQSQPVQQSQPIQQSQPVQPVQQSQVVTISDM